VNVGVLEITREAAGAAAPARSGVALLPLTQDQGCQPQGQALLADPRRAMEEKRLRKASGLHRRPEASSQIFVSRDRGQAQLRPLSHRTGSTWRGRPSRSGS
jgi:hypothetical protein